MGKYDGCDQADRRSGHSRAVRRHVSGGHSEVSSVYFPDTIS